MMVRLVNNKMNNIVCRLVEGGWEGPMVNNLKN